MSCRCCGCGCEVPERAENDLKSIKRRGGDDVEADLADASARASSDKTAMASRPARVAVYSGNGFHDGRKDAARAPAGHRPTR